MTGKYVVISGQHRLAASRKILEEEQAAGRPAPTWCTKFKVKEVKPGTDLKTRQTIAGMLQGREMTVHAMTLSDRVAWMVREVEEQRAAAADPGQLKIRRAEVLRNTYEKTGCNEATDGSVVCTLCLIATSILNHIVEEKPFFACTLLRDPANSLQR